MAHRRAGDPLAPVVLGGGPVLPPVDGVLLGVVLLPGTSLPGVSDVGAGTIDHLGRGVLQLLRVSVRGSLSAGRGEHGHEGRDDESGERVAVSGGSHDVLLGEAGPFPATGAAHTSPVAAGPRTGCDRVVIEERTHTSSADQVSEAAAYVDEELAPILATRGGPTIVRVVAEAIARFHPEQAEEAEAAGKDAWDVRIQHPGIGAWAGTSWLDACADSVDLTKFEDLVADIARRLGEAGDLDTSEQRRAKTIGIVADVQAGADLTT